MSVNPDESLLHALKIAFCYLPKAIEVNQYDYGDRVEKVLADIEMVRAALLAQGVDPEEVSGEMNSDGGGPSCL
ncbi:MAG: penicillin-binding protein [Steroidobacteraceae bacterium]